MGALEIVDSPDCVWEATALLNGSSLVGFVVHGVHRGTMSLRYLAVAPQYRGQGHGRRLVDRVRKRCLELRVEELSLFVTREMVPFYCSLGFREVADEEEGISEDDLQVPMVCIVPIPSDEATLDAPLAATVDGADGYTGHTLTSAIEAAAATPMPVMQVAVRPLGAVVRSRLQGNAAQILRAELCC